MTGMAAVCATAPFCKHGSQGGADQGRSPRGASGVPLLVPSMRTERATRRTNCCTVFPHVRDVQSGATTASDHA
jgi:hypothetical protein